MADGTTKAIEDIQPGDEVLATNPETGDTQPKTVTATIITTDDKQYVDLTTTTDDGSHTLTTTDHHPFWSPSNGTWTDAGDLTPGTTLRTNDGTTTHVQEVHKYASHHTTHNLTVANTHTYYVLAGKTPILVHNSGPNCGVPFGGRNGDHLGGKDFHGSEYSLDEITEFVNGHTGDGNPVMGRPSAVEVETTLRQAGPRQLEGQNASRFDHGGVRVIVNWDMPWKSTAYYPRR